MSTTPDETQPATQPEGMSEGEATQPTTPPADEQVTQPTTPLPESQLTLPTVPLPDARPGSAPAEGAVADPFHSPSTDAFGSPVAQATPVTYTTPAAPEPPAAPFSQAHSYAGTTEAQVAAAPSAQAPQRHGGLIAGIAIGALLGGLVGGGAAAVVAHNSNTGSTVQASQNGGTLTINNPSDTTAITAVAAVATPSVVTIQASDGSNSGTGSGVIYSADGYIITNAHVATLEGATGNPTIQVQMSDGTLHPGKLVGSDPFADIAVIKIDATGLTPIQVADSTALNVGDLAVAIGAPLSLSNTVTSGVVSALNRGISVASSMVPEQQSGQNDTNGQTPNGQGNPFPWFEFDNPNSQQQSPSTGATVAIPVIQTDASINPGNSGGALLDSEGKLIGINVALASTGGSNAAAGSDGLGFAVPSNLATRVADALIAGDKPSHGLLGVLQTGQNSAENAAGGVVGEVTPNGPADKAGLKPGDVITSINGVRADSFTTVTALIRMYPSGTEVTIGYNRDGQQFETKATLGEMEW